MLAHLKNAVLVPHDFPNGGRYVGRQVCTGTRSLIEPFWTAKQDSVNKYGKKRHLWAVMQKYSQEMTEKGRFKRSRAKIFILKAVVQEQSKEHTF